jgi:hypothetical protein
VAQTNLNLLALLAGKFLGFCVHSCFPLTYLTLVLAWLFTLFLSYLPQVQVPHFKQEAERLLDAFSS